MHLGDGIVTQTPLVLGLNLAGVAGCAVALARLRGTRTMPAWTGTLAAFVFVAQALNIPIVPGASAHIIGTALLTLTLGPARAIVALTAVLLVQALMLGDGGVTVLGINVVTMAIVPSIVVHVLRRAAGEGRRGLAIAAVAGSTLGSLGGALTLTLVLVSGAHAPAVLTASWLVSVQTLAGLAEGVLTAIAVRELALRAPALIHEVRRTSTPRPATSARTAVIAVACAGLALVAALPWMTSLPDALTVVLAHLGLAK